MSLSENDMVTAENSRAESDILMRIFGAIIHRWWLFLFIGIIGAIGGYMYASSQKPVYESYLSFALDEGGSESGGGGAAMGIAAQLGISLGGAQDVFTGDNILEIMTSRRVIENVLLSVDTFDNKAMTLIEFYVENNLNKSSGANSSGGIHFYPGESRSNFSYAKDSLLYKVYLEFKNFRIIARRPDKRLNLFEVLVSSHFEKFSKVFTDKLIYQTNQFYTEIRSKKAKETLEILEKRVPDMKGKLDATISSKAAIEDANLNTAFSSAQVPLLKQQSNTQVYGTAYAEMFKNLEMARFQYLKSIPLMQVIDPADYPMKKIEMGKLETAAIFSVVAVFIFLIFFIGIHVFKYKGKLKRLS
ncbi:MAG: Wzz/FepE/Etk N-terminal domain-containing protein [Ginsengibacter sp.]